MCFRGKVNRANAGLSSLGQGARIAIVAHDDSYASGYASARKGLDEALKRRSFMRRKNSKVHCRYWFVWLTLRFSRGASRSHPSADGCKRLLGGFSSGPQSIWQVSRFVVAHHPDLVLGNVQLGNPTV